MKATSYDQWLRSKILPGRYVSWAGTLYDPRELQKWIADRQPKKEAALKPEEKKEEQLTLPGALVFGQPIQKKGKGKKKMPEGASLI